MQQLASSSSYLGRTADLVFEVCLAQFVHGPLISHAIILSIAVGKSSRSSGPSWRRRCARSLTGRTLWIVFKKETRRRRFVNACKARGCASQQRDACAEQRAA